MIYKVIRLWKNGFEYVDQEPTKDTAISLAEYIWSSMDSEEKEWYKFVGVIEMENEEDKEPKIIWEGKGGATNE